MKRKTSKPAAPVPVTSSRRPARTKSSGAANSECQPEAIRIRAARPADAAIIARFNRAMALETEARELSPPRVLRGVKALLADPAKGVYFVAEADGEIIGQTLITYEWSDWRNGNFWWIQSVYVAPAHRGRGVFKALHQHIHQLARRQKDICGLRLYVDGHNSQAKEVYARLGMARTDYELWEEDFRRRTG